MADSPTPYERDAWIVELKLFLRNGAESRKRTARWLAHANVFREMSNARGTTRLVFLSGHLDILDRKFSTLLQFQALLPIAINVLLSGIKIHRDLPWNFALGAFTLLWFVNIVLCLNGVRRLEWGDLWRYEDNPADAEQDHIERLIPEIVRRTAQFRIAVLLTVIEVFSLALLVRRPR